MNAKTIITAVSLSSLPALGTDFEGGTFAGITTRADGTHCAVVLLPSTSDDLTWEQAKAWAEEKGGELPTRPVAAMLFSSVKPALAPEWHWTADEYSDSYAWFCNFLNGTQYGGHQGNELSAVAVRMIPLTA